jgi:hypothetical protein
MLEYLDTTDSDSDFIPESDTGGGGGDKDDDDAPHATLPAAHSEEYDMDDKDYSEILSP